MRRILCYTLMIGLLPVVFGVWAPGSRAWGQAPGRESATVADALVSLAEIMQIPGKSIPSFLFEKAEGVAVFPNLKKGGFILGAQRGRGVLVVKNQSGVWENPRFVTLTGGSIGFQAGIQSADVVLVFCTQRSVESALKGHFTIGADATVTAGPVGRQASVGTDIQLTSEIYSYSRSRGIFLGAAVDGCLMENDADAHRAYYAEGTPEHATQLTQLIASYAKKATDPVEGMVPEGLGPEGSPFPAPAPETLPVGDEGEFLRARLFESAQRLNTILEPEWQIWLALPPEIGAPNGPKPGLATLQTVQARFRAVDTNPQYADLKAREEFQTTLRLLEEYLEKY